jgi:hypothetical protein
MPVSNNYKGVLKKKAPPMLGFFYISLYKSDFNGLITKATYQVKTTLFVKIRANHDKKVV